MSGTYEATVEWRARGDDDFAAHRYSRAHRWHFDGGAEIPASASPHVVRQPWSDPAAVDPEEALVAALASCHMLFFLDLASSADLMIESYRDAAVGTMGKRDDGREAMVAVMLRPEIAFTVRPAPAALAELHHRAHQLCYLANSVNFPVTVEGQS